MSYQVLARKYRPRNFETLVGQEHVVRALTHALHSGRLHHAYLFTGTRGVGKTTLSRILAKSLNCVGPDGDGGITATPCGVCEACTAIDGGRFVDYIEMDAASNRGVDEMAQLLEQAVYAPSNARFKVYMIDEVHMLTNHAFNSMLKTLEEPPEHVKFILATTDPQKIPVTVLSRCLQFNLKQMPPGHIIGHLDNILGQEGIAFEQPALRLLAQGAHGSMRDALSLTDQAIAYAAGEVTLEAVQGMLGALDQSYLIRLLDALARQDGADLLAVADEMATRSLSYNGALQDLGTLLHRIALAQTVPSAVPSDLPEYADIVRLAAEFDAEEVQLYYQIAVHGRNELGLAPDEYAGFSMTLLRMLAFRPGVGGAEGLPAAARGPGAARAAAAAAGVVAGAPARAASASLASHASLPPSPSPSVVAGAAAMARADAGRPAAPQAAGFPAGGMNAQPAAATAGTGGHMAAQPAGAAPRPAAPAPQPTASAPQPAASALRPAASVPQSTASVPQAAASASSVPLSPARAAIQAALEAARAASGMKPLNRPVAPAPSAEAAPAAPQAPAAAEAATPAPAAARAPAPWEDAQPDATPAAGAPHSAASPASAGTAPSRAASPAPWEDASSADAPGTAGRAAGAPSAPWNDAPAANASAAPRAAASAPWDDASGQAAPSRASAPASAPWDDGRPSMGAAAPAAAQRQPEPEPEDDLPPWVTEFSDDSASAMPAGEAAAAPAPQQQAPSRAPARPTYAYVITPVPELDWDGNWPALAARLPLRGVAQQLATQAELIECLPDGAHSAQFRIRVPIETWRTPANVEKLAVALTERFGRPVRVETELGPAFYTASAEAAAHREAVQRAAEQTVANDPFIKSMIRDFGAFVVPGSIVPPPAPAAH
ncbi:DNA polymerase III subunit gamma/tau [Pseudoduganella namucuonensis]|uniref:DNA-directed DNA polymerase n=1 Tax=Pseudoduganella namucuonensis TaxID=1035707 RepID=A0A1I7KVG3_9BURK|nr:DNA polymerase III subunit gamma/tau [Pseudoduganella namucuonensis]SFV01395.1 DNA polymerase-3 subunit gamma/tau [Pseudoduganella namucuonensis]